MKLLIDTTGKDLFVSLIQDGATISFIELKDLREKSEKLPIVVMELLSNKKLSDIDDFYVVKGPGSFMGVRAGLMFAIAASVVGNKDIYTTDSLKFVSGGAVGIYHRDASGGNSYEYKNGEYTIINGTKNSAYPMADVVANPQKYLNLFTKDTDPKPLYIKEPRIG